MTRALLILLPIALSIPSDAFSCACHGDAIGASQLEGLKKAYPLARTKQVRKPSQDSGRPPTLPTNWGGQGKLMPEAILANASSAALNEGWSQPGAIDVAVAIPTKFYDGHWKPYGDGQSNARASFESWSAQRPPVVATLIHYRDRAPEMTIRFDQSMGLRQTELQLSFMGKSKPIPLNNGMARWKDIPPQLGWDRSAQTQVVFVRPSPGYSDWFPITFRHPVKKIPDLVASVPADKRKFPSDGKPIVDAEEMRQTSEADAIPFANMIHHAFPPRYNPKNHGKAWENPTIHSPYKLLALEEPHSQIGPDVVTGVGKGWTWVAEGDAPFKILYTCFDKRDAEAEARAGGVVSGGGWHVIGDQAETILNSVELAPVVVASGFAQPGTRFGNSTPGGISYGLTDVAVFRWLQPGEAFVTGRTEDAAKPNLHWFYFQENRPVCTEEWVHPCQPGIEDPDFRCQ